MFYSTMVEQILAALQGGPCKLQVMIMMLQSMSMVRKRMTLFCVVEMIANPGSYITVEC